MRDRSPRRTLVLFSILAIYIALQFVWWAVLLVRKDREATDLLLQLHALEETSAPAVDAGRGLRMIVGEGSVLLFLLLLVLYLTYRAIRRDLDLARTQRNFLLAVTHELRTPIAAVKLQLQTLARSGLSDGQREELRVQALSEADRLSTLTDKVLLATSAEDGVLDLDRRELDVMDLMRQIVARAGTHAAAYHRLQLEGPDHLFVHSDAEALRSIADNLIENAAKYTPAGTTIAIAIQPGANGWRLQVSDEGPGIPEEERSRIFEKFYRGGNEETRNAKGTGLGLYIVQRLAHRLGGAVTVKAGEPHGAIFAASFPDR